MPRARRKLLNVRLIRERCLALGLSRRELGARICVSDVVVRGIFQERNHAELTLSLVEKLASELGVEPTDLLQAETPEIPQVAPDAALDSVKVEAALMEAGRLVRVEALARGFQWKLARIRQALDELDDKLTGTGLRLRYSNGGVTIQPRPTILSIAERERFERARLATEGLRVNAARILKLVVDGRLDAAWERQASNDDRVQLYVLLKQGLIEHAGDQFIARPEVVYSLSE
jgi:transcriptional regulator with XRE-family HTH domain